MVRGVVVVLVTIFTMIAVSLVAAPVVEDLGEHIKTYDTIDDGELNGTSVINDVYDALFVYVPLIGVGGMLLFGVVWYLRRERVPRGGGRI